MTAVTNDHSAFAQRYASAYLDSIDDKKISSIAEEASSVLGLIHESKELTSIIENPLFSEADKKAILEQIAKKGKFSKELTNFILTILKNGRLAQLPAILNAVLFQVNQRQGAINATVETAYPLNKTQETKIAKEIGAITGGKANMTVHVNPDLIGGIVITIGSQRYDGSVKRRLELLAQDLREGAKEQTNVTPNKKKKA